MNQDKLEHAPDWLKWGLTAFQRVGFPSLMCFILLYLVWFQSEKQSKNIEDFKVVLIQMKNSLDEVNDTNKRMTEAMYRTRNR